MVKWNTHAEWKVRCNDTYGASTKQPIFQYIQQEWRNQSNFSWEDQGNHDNFSRPFYQPDYQQESKQHWEVANNTDSERLDKIEVSIKNIEVLLGQLANSNNSWDLEDLPSQEELEFDLVEDISEHTEQPSFTNHIFMMK